MLSPEVLHAVSSTDVPEAFFRHIENPHDQTVLTKPTLYAYPEMSNQCLKT
jgi:hypothetical protein